MLKLAVIESQKSNLYWWSFVNEFSQKLYGGKTFLTMATAVDFANENITYVGEAFDLISINQPEYLILDSLSLH